MLVDRYAVEAELRGELELVEITVVELVPFLRIEIGVRQHHPGGAIFIAEAHVQISVGHEVKHEDFHRRLRQGAPRGNLIVRCRPCFTSGARLAGATADPLASAACERRSRPLLFKDSE